MKNRIWAVGQDLGSWYSLSFWGVWGEVSPCQALFCLPDLHDSLDGTLEFCKPVGWVFKKGEGMRGVLSP